MGNFLDIMHDGSELPVDSDFFRTLVVDSVEFFDVTYVGKDWLNGGYSIAVTISRIWGISFSTLCWGLWVFTFDDDAK